MDDILVGGHDVDLLAPQSTTRNDTTDTTLNPVRYVIFHRFTCVRISRIRHDSCKWSGRGAGRTLRKRTTGGAVELTRERMNETRGCDGTETDLWYKHESVDCLSIQRGRCWKIWMSSAESEYGRRI